MVLSEQSIQELLKFTAKKVQESGIDPLTNPEGVLRCLFDNWEEATNHIATLAYIAEREQAEADALEAKMNADGWIKA